MDPVLHGPPAAGSPLTRQSQCPMFEGATALRPGPTTAGQTEPRTRWMFGVRYGHHPRRAHQTSVLIARSSLRATAARLGMPRSLSRVEHAQAADRTGSSLTNQAECPMLGRYCPASARPQECSLTETCTDWNDVPSRFPSVPNIVPVLIVPGAMCSALIARSTRQRDGIRTLNGSSHPLVVEVRTAVRHPD
jgi:hypothetical protein